MIENTIKKNRIENTLIDSDNQLPELSNNEDLKEHGYKTFDANCSFENAQVVLIGGSSGLYNKEISSLLRNKLGKSDVILNESGSQDENLTWSLKKDNSNPNSCFYGINGLDKKISMFGLNDYNLKQERFRKITKILNCSQILNSKGEGEEIENRTQIRELFNQSYEEYLILCKEIDYKFADAIKNKISPTSKTYAIMDPENVTKENITTELQKAGIDYVALVPDVVKKRGSGSF